MSSDDVIRVLEETLKEVNFYHAPDFTTRLYENTGLDTSQMPAGTYIGAVKNHKLSGVQIFILHGVPRRDKVFLYEPGETWARFTSQPTTFDAQGILTNKVIDFHPNLSKYVANFVNREREMQQYHVDGTGIHIYMHIKGIAHSGHRTNVHGLLKHSDRFLVSRLDSGERAREYSAGNNSLAVPYYSGGYVGETPYHHSSPSLNQHLARSQH